MSPPCVCDMIHSYVCDMTHSCGGHDPFICVWHDSFICVQWRTYMCDMTHSYIWPVSFICVRMSHGNETCECSICVWYDSFMCATWLIHAVYDTCEWVLSHIWMSHVYIYTYVICVTWLIHFCDMTHSYVWHDSFEILKRISIPIEFSISSLIFYGTRCIWSPNDSMTPWSVSWSHDSMHHRVGQIDPLMHRVKCPTFHGMSHMNESYHTHILHSHVSFPWLIRTHINETGQVPDIPWRSTWIGGVVTLMDYMACVAMPSVPPHVSWRQITTWLWHGICSMPTRPYESCKIFKGRPRRNAFSKLVYRQYKSFLSDRFCQLEIQITTGLSNKPSTA